MLTRLSLIGVTAALLIEAPAFARTLTVSDWQAQVYRVTHRDSHGSFDQDENAAFLFRDYQSAAAAMSTGYYRAVRRNLDAITAGKPLFCPPTKDPELSSGPISTYFDTLPPEYRQKTAMVDAMLGYAIATFPCPAAGH